MTTQAQIFSETLKKIGVSPVLKGRFSPEQLSRYSVMNRRLNEAPSGRPFRIVFCGVFSSGKTSLISSLLECNELKLPVGINPVTKMITRIRYGSALRCFYMSGGSQQFISTAEMEQIVQGKKQISADSSEIIITVPSQFLWENVEIIDTPGFDDEAGELERISKTALSEADMAVLCCNALMLGKITDKNLLQELENITGHFSLVITRIDNMNDTNDYEEMMAHARRLMKGRSNFVFPVAAAGRYKNIDSFRKYIIRVISDRNLMLKIQQVSLRKSTALYAEEIRTVTDRAISELTASLNKLEAVNSRAIRTQELDAQMEVSRFENMKSAALNAASAFIAQRASFFRTAVNGLYNTYTFQNDAKKLADQAIGQIISDLAEYAQSKNINGYKSVSHDLVRAFEEYSYSIPAPVKRWVKSRGILGQTAVTALSLFVSVFDGFDSFEIDDGYDSYYEDYHEPAVSAFLSGPAAWLLGKWNSYLDGAGAGIKTSGFTGGHEQEIKRTKNSIAQCEGVKALAAQILCGTSDVINFEWAK